ncbi:MAG: LemA family protein [Proteobacteria bacterium]|nr:LemA family protein [Pseudomonadota bacterium]MDA0952223.1 LemA family protein [Pseudomonadota bacterium]
MIEFIVIALLVLVAVGIALWAIAIYNGLVARRQRTAEAWSGIDVQLKRRASLIPNLVETVKGYAGHEKQTLAEVTEMRTRVREAEGGGVAERAQAESAMSGALMRLFAVAEAYPELRANQNFLDLQSELSSLEDQIQMARRYYNGAVRDLNTMIESFPSNLVARRFSFEQPQYYEAESPADRSLPEVKF